MERKVQYRILVLVALTVLLSFRASAATVTIYASGSGWCESAGTCNNTGYLLEANTYAGSPDGIVQYRNWFAFPVWSGGYSSATLHIWNAAGNANAATDKVYSLYEATGFSYSGLAGGNVIFGAVALADANTGAGHYVPIALNAAGLAFLNDNAQIGWWAIFGGDVAGAQQGEKIFCCTAGVPRAYLELTLVPEPGAAGLMGLGLAALGAAVRRRRTR